MSIRKYLFVLFKSHCYLCTWLRLAVDCVYVDLAVFINSPFLSRFNFISARFEMMPSRHARFHRACACRGWRLTARSLLWKGILSQLRWCFFWHWDRATEESMPEPGTFTALSALVVLLFQPLMLVPLQLLLYATWINGVRHAPRPMKSQACLGVFETFKTNFGQMFQQACRCLLSSPWRSTCICACTWACTWGFRLDLPGWPVNRYGSKLVDGQRIRHRIRHRMQYELRYEGPSTTTETPKRTSSRACCHFFPCHQTYFTIISSHKRSVW